MADKKRFPADTKLDVLTFLNDKKVNGELYAYLQSLSTHDSKQGTYVLKKDLPTQAKICEAIGIKSPKTLRVHLGYLSEVGLIIEEKDKYILPDQEDIYFLIPLNTLQYLTDNCKEHVIKIYIYLGQRWKWAQQRGTPYRFTYREIGEHIGINKIREDLMNRQIKNALLLLINSEMIDFEEGYENKVPYKELTKFSFDFKDVKNITKKIR